MKTVTGVLVALIAIAHANVVSYSNNNNNNNNGANVLNQQQLLNQQDILSLLENVQSPNRNQNQANIGRNFINNFSSNKFQNPQAAQKFIQAYKSGSLQPRGSPFSNLDYNNLKEAVNLFEVFYSAVDYSTFYAAACFARDQINEGQFVYAFYTAIVHRPDTKYLALPSISQVYPQLFVKASAIKQAQNAAAQGQNNFQTLIQQSGQCQNNNNYPTECNKSVNSEDSTSYFREDIALNENNFYFHIQYPFWFSPKGNNNDNIPDGNQKAFNKKSSSMGYYFNNKNNYNDEDNSIYAFRGEIFYTYLQQTVARYNLERVANGLSDVQPLELDEAIESGFNPELQYENGQAVPSRPANMQVQNNKFQKKLADFIKTHEQRIKEAIDANALKNKFGSITPINPYYATNAVANCVESNPDCPNNQYYGSLFLELLKFAGGVTDPNKHLGLSASVLENYQTMIRDPAFFNIAKRVVDLVTKYKDVHFQPYSNQELSFEGVQVQSLEVSDLVTYNDNAEVNINNAVNNNGNYKAYNSRLNHKPFNIRLSVSSGQSQPALVRIFLGSKVSQNGEQLSLEQQRANVVLLDKFAVQLQSGSNQIERSSDQFTQGGNEAPSAAEIKTQIQQALNGNQQIINRVGGPNNNAPCGLPRRLQLPKGSSSGQQYFIYAIVSPELDAQHPLVTMQNPCGNVEYFDLRPNLFPFDRSLSQQDEFNIPNVHKHNDNIFQQYFCAQNKNNNMCRYFSNQQNNNVQNYQVSLNVPNAKLTEVTITHRSSNPDNDNNKYDGDDDNNYNYNANSNNYNDNDEQINNRFQTRKNKFYSF